MSSQAVLGLATCAALVGACQDYPFEVRAPRRVDARQINEVVAQVKPADILFVIDNSGTMAEETTALKNNVAQFVTELSGYELDFQVGIVTTDVECNLPTRNCPSGSSAACCSLQGTRAVCQDQDTNGDGQIDTSNCEGGRLVAADGVTRIFKRPEPSERDAWIADFVATIEQAENGLKGSSYESGLEAARRAVACAVGDPSCPDPAVAALNAGFVREGADLVVIFVSDEDDCSAADVLAYSPGGDMTNAVEQASHFCHPNECYAHYGAALDTDVDGVMDWADDITAPAERLSCFADNRPRLANPPSLAPVDAFVDAFASYKGGIAKVRAAGIVGVVPDDSQALGVRGAGCFNALSGPSGQCGCVSQSDNFSCLVTQSLGQRLDRVPTGTGFAGGCVGAPGGRYVQFMNSLRQSLVDAGSAPDVLADSICRSNYDQTMDRIVNNVIINNCFSLETPVTDPANVQIKLNGTVLPLVDYGGGVPGWAMVGPTTLCLSGGLSKNINDRFEILLVTSVTQTE